MTVLTLRSLAQDAETIDILADNLKPLIDAAAKCGLEELFTVIQILNRRGVKIGVLEDYGLLRRKHYEFAERARRRAAKEILEREYVKRTALITEALSKESGTTDSSDSGWIEALECLK